MEEPIDQPLQLNWAHLYPQTRNKCLAEVSVCIVAPKATRRSLSWSAKRLCWQKSTMTHPYPVSWFFQRRESTQQNKTSYVIVPEPLPISALNGSGLPDVSHKTQHIIISLSGYQIEHISLFLHHILPWFLVNTGLVPTISTQTVARTQSLVGALTVPDSA